ncbi:winged helix-turn-helix domain-containing protein [Aeromicrobium piscarium]|uniref:Winged helix-turn-helix transcriptional regulator n=1 Tax=Aeromicrobium piscarium TaxID=2590901 RepID=A0A554SH86_9ACTN|nr:winged helix-turn-helix domain-containing protein [Aeromicrobium piscarium]TSD65701.1 winged helix-turn-helix transcriptional regulator [Aeromicrobium piscarium]
MSGELHELSPTERISVRSDVRTWRARSDASEVLILVEPDIAEADRIGRELTQRGVRFLNFVSPWRALAHLGSESSAVVVVSSGLGQGPLEVIVEAVRAETSLPVLIAYRPDETDVIGPAVAAGGRPLIIHPYEASDMIRIVCEVLPAPAPPACVEFGRLSLVPEWQDAQLDEKGIDLSPLEFHVLSELVRRAGRAASKEALIAAAWSGTSPDPNALLAAAIKRIRHKFMARGVCEAIETVRGVGYRLSAAALGGAPQMGVSHGVATPISPMSRSTRAEMSSTIRRTS